MSSPPPVIPANSAPCSVSFMYPGYICQCCHSSPQGTSVNVSVVTALPRVHLSVSVLSQLCPRIHLSVSVLSQLSPWYTSQRQCCHSSTRVHLSVSVLLQLYPGYTCQCVRVVTALPQDTSVSISVVTLHPRVHLSVSVFSQLHPKGHLSVSVL